MRSFWGTLPVPRLRQGLCRSLGRNNCSSRRTSVCLPRRVGLNGALLIDEKKPPAELTKDRINAVTDRIDSAGVPWKARSRVLCTFSLSNWTFLSERAAPLNDKLNILNVRSELNMFPRASTPSSRRILQLRVCTLHVRCRCVDASGALAVGVGDCCERLKDERSHGNPFVCSSDTASGSQVR